MAEIVITTKDELMQIVRDAVESVAIIPRQQTPVKKKVYTNKQAMAYLNVSRSTLQRWRNDGTLPFRKVHGKILYTEKDLQKLLENAAMKPQENCSKD